MRTAPFFLASALLLALAACSGDGPTGTGGAGGVGGASGTTSTPSATVDYACASCTCTCAGAPVYETVYQATTCDSLLGTPCDPPADAGATGGGYTFEACTVTSVSFC